MQLINLYMKELWEILGKELTNSYRLQRWARNKRLMNWFFGRASKKKEEQNNNTKQSFKLQSRKNQRL